MKELALKYGCNPNQKPSKIFMHDGTELPIEIRLILLRRELFSVSIITELLRRMQFRHWHNCRM